MYFDGTYGLHIQGRRISQARKQRDCRWRASETSVDFQRTTRRYIPEDSSTLYYNRCENLKFIALRSMKYTDPRGVTL
jgi:hypothetical protein